MAKGSVKPVAPTRLRDLAMPGGSDILRFSPLDIQVEAGFNPRLFDTLRMREKLDALKTSIAAQGVLQPLLVRYDGGKAILVDGETRLRAVRELIAEGECGTAFQRLVGHGWSAEDIAAKVGYSLRYVTDALALFDTPQAVKKLVAENKITPAHAIAAVKKQGTAAAVALVAEVVKREAAGNTAPVKRPRAAAANPYKDIAQAIHKIIKPQLHHMDNGGERFDSVDIPVKLARKLLAVMGEL